MVNMAQHTGGKNSAEGRRCLYNLQRTVGLRYEQGLPGDRKIKGLN